MAIIKLSIISRELTDEYTTCTRKQSTFFYLRVLKENAQCLRGLVSIIFQEWADTRTLSYTPGKVKLALSLETFSIFL